MVVDAENKSRGWRPGEKCVKSYVDKKIGDLGSTQGNKSTHKLLCAVTHR